MNSYDPFARGRYAVGARSLTALDADRKRTFPIEVWHPEARGGTWPLIIYSHPSGADRKAATFLSTHLASHGYMVAALDHSEVIVPEFARRAGETPEQRSARWDALIANRVPDVRFLLDQMLGDGWKSEARPDPARFGIVGHSFGGWTALAAAQVEERIRAVVALAPGGIANPKPGILPLKLDFTSGRDVPTLYLVAENDTSFPLADMVELFERAPADKQMVILRRADHLHFMDGFARLHESVRTGPFPPELASLQKEMLPISELSSEEQAHLFVRGLALAHFDSVLREGKQARRFLEGDIVSELAKRGVDAQSYL